MPAFRHSVRLLSLAVILSHGALRAGPYSEGLNDPTNASDAPVPGFVGPDGEGKARLDDGFGGFDNARNFVNPLFFGWAVDWADYLRADGQTSFHNPSLGLGPVTGDNFDVLSLGDLSGTQLNNSLPPGRITLRFTNALQPQPMRNLPGADFVVFENGVFSEFSTGGEGVGGIFGELAYVEVSSDGVNFARFPSISLTPAAVGSYGTLLPTAIFNLAGKHVNAYGESWGTPFDLAHLATHPLVVAGTVNLNDVRYVRIVDIPGNGSFLDTALPTPHPIYDSWLTFGSGGFDLEAVGVISAAITFNAWQDLKGLAGDQRGANADPDFDGVPNLVEYAFALLPLTPDAEQMPAPVLAGGALAIRFRRDTRPVDLKVEVLGTSGLQQPWEIIARAEAGGPLAAVAPFTPVIEDASASHLASVGVIRRPQVFAAPAQRFLKIQVSLLP